MLMDPYRGVGHMPFVRCIELGCVAYVSIGWVGDEVVIGVGVGIEWWWFYVVGLIGGELMVVGSVVGMVVGSVVGVVVGSIVGVVVGSVGVVVGSVVGVVVGSVVGVVVGSVGSVGVVVGIIVEVVVGGNVVFVVVVTLEVAPTGCEGRPNSGVEKHAFLDL